MLWQMGSKDRISVFETQSGETENQSLKNSSLRGRMEAVPGITHHVVEVDGQGRPKHVIALPPEAEVGSHPGVNRQRER
jgi:hypothetical protein